MDQAKSAGPGGMFLLFLVFLVLKLCEVINWSWWWVTAPLWGPPVVIIGILVVILAFVIAIFIIIKLVDLAIGRKTLF